MVSSAQDYSDTTHFIFYRYSLSLAAAVIFFVLFSLSTAVHVFQIIKKRTWYFIPLAVGGVFELSGYIGRLLSHKDQWALGPYLLQQLLLLTAPALFAASIYIVLGRIIQLVDGERHSLVKTGWITAMFVTGDVLSFLIQGAGGGILGASKGNPRQVDLGETLVIVGLFFQLAYFAAFVTVAGIFHLRLVRACTKRDSASPVNIDALPWKRHLATVYVTSGLTLVRSVFRVVEYIQGNTGYLLRQEVFLYMFDSLLMLAVMVLFNYVHPSQVTDAYQQRIRRAGADGGLSVHGNNGRVELIRSKEGQGPRL